MPSTAVQRKPSERQTTRPFKRLIVPIFIVLFGFCAVCAHVLLEARRTTWERAGDVASSLAAAIETEVSRNIESIDLSLQEVVDNLKHPDIDRIDPQLRRLILFDRSTTARHIGRILVLDESGNVRLDSRSLEPTLLNVADRDYFKAHKESTTLGLYISRPAISRVTGQWFVGLSRRLSHPDGTFAGVVMASLRLSYFEQLFKNAALGPDGNITLSRTDGIVLTRWPYKAEYIGLDLRDAKVFKELARSRSGRFETYAATDGLHRLIVYSQIADLPLVVGVGQSTADIYAQWNNYAFGISFLIAVLCALTLALTMYLMHELRRREAAEMKLADLAAIDSLTGLFNRRHFDEVLRREWQRSMRERSPLALMMIDTDRFKSYNDVHGHQAGDNLLKTIGAAIASSINRGGDFSARYGGDEFVIALPGTSAEGAKQVAELIHQALAELCEREGTSHASLSIGIACATATASADSQPSGLVGQADLALYRAKHRGRNRTEISAIDPNELAAGPALDRSKAA